MLSEKEVEMLEEAGRRMAPGFELWDRGRMVEAWKLAAAAEENACDPVLHDGAGEMKLGRLMVKVCRDKRREGYGVPHVWWWIGLQYELFPWLKGDPWLEVKWWGWDELRGKRRCLTMWGAQNSTKSAFLGIFAVTQMVAWGSDAYVYVGGPVKMHGSDKAIREIFRLVGSLSAGIKDRGFVKGLGLKSCGAVKEAAWVEGIWGRADCTYVALESASAIQGKKADKHEPTGLHGITILAVDEFIENPFLELKEGISNLRSNANFFGMLACNPKPDKVQHPNMRGFSWPVEATSLRRDEAFAWKTAWGKCMRFAWVNCPNNLLGRTEWPYMLDQLRVEAQKDTAEEAIVAAQVDAWGFGSGHRDSPLDEAGIRLAGTYTEPVWMGPAQRLCAFDCSFGGNDPAGVCVLEAGPVMRRAKDGEAVERKVFAAVDQFEFLVEEDFHATAEWIAEMEAIFEYTGGGWPETERFADVQPGQFMGAAWDMAKKAGAILMQYQVPPQNVTFDASQRADCADAMLAVLGRSNVRWWYEGSRKIQDEEKLGAGGWYFFPFRYEKDAANGQKTPVLWSDRVSEVSSMVWFLACEMVKAGYLVHGQVVQKGLDELCARPIERGRRGQGTGKKDVMSKVRMKALGMRSPMYAETLAMAMYLGTRWLGLVDLGEPAWLSTAVKQNLPAGRLIQERVPRKLNWKRPFPKEASRVVGEVKATTDHLALLNRAVLMK